MLANWLSKVEYLTLLLKMLLSTIVFIFYFTQGSAIVTLSGSLLFVVLKNAKLPNILRLLGD